MFNLVVFDYEFRQHVMRLNDMVCCVIKGEKSVTSLNGISSSLSFKIEFMF